MNQEELDKKIRKLQMNYFRMMCSFVLGRNGNTSEIEATMTTFRNEWTKHDSIICQSDSVCIPDEMYDLLLLQEECNNKIHRFLSKCLTSLSADELALCNAYFLDMAQQAVHNAIYSSLAKSLTDEND